MQDRVLLLLDLQPTLESDIEYESSLGQLCIIASDEILGMMQQVPVRATQ